MSKRCPGYDEDNLCCISYGGKNNEGETAECYKFFKPQVSQDKSGLLSRIFSWAAESFMRAEGIKNN